MEGGLGRALLIPCPKATGIVLDIPQVCSAYLRNLETTT
jgi:hypothetical protein